VWAASLHTAWEHVEAMEEGTARTRLDPEVGERFLPLRRQLGVTSFGMNQVVLEPGQRGRIHRHARQEEVYLVLEGTLTIYLEGEETELERGELLRVAPAIRRQLVNRGPGRLVLLALGGAGEHRGRDGEAFAGWGDEEPTSPQELAMPPDLEPGELRT
jgi:quercetin dioxygenase-like cupin family protein